MRTSSDHIPTSHAGSLPRPDDLIEAWQAADERAVAEKLTASVADVVRRQKEAGIELPGEPGPTRQHFQRPDSNVSALVASRGITSARSAA